MIRRAYTPAELRQLAKDHGPFFADTARAALEYCADVIEAADAVIKEAPAPPTLLQFVSNEEMTEILRELAQAASKGLSPDLDAIQCAVLTNLIRHYIRRSPPLVGEKP